MKANSKRIVCPMLALLRSKLACNLKSTIVTGVRERMHLSSTSQWPSPNISYLPESLFSSEEVLYTGEVMWPKNLANLQTQL